MSNEIDVDMEVPYSQQDKDARRIYSFNLDGLMPPADSLAAPVAWSVSPAGGAAVVSQSETARACSIKVAGGTASTWYSFVGAWVGVSGVQDQIVFRVFVKPDAEALPQLGSALFPNRYTAVARLRSDRLLAAAALLPNVAQVSDDYLWEKLLAAEADASRTLRVQFQPTQYFPVEPTQDEITALAGMPWEIDPGYDYEPDFFRSDRWGFLQARHVPLVSVSQVRIIFPSAQASTYYTIPPDWLRMDRKYGEIQFVPASGLGGAPLAAFMLQGLSAGRMLPFAIRVTYVAGLQNAAAKFPDLLDAVQKMAVIKAVEDHFLPTSGSISADGLSQSISNDMDKHRDTVDRILQGRAGSNGGLMAAIHGVRLGVL